MRGLILFCVMMLSGPATALSPVELQVRGDGTISCLFTERCLIGQPRKRAWREPLWCFHDQDGHACRHFADGRVRTAKLMLDARWGALSDARVILTPMHEALASHLTIFNDGGATYSIQYAGSPGSGQFLRSDCDLPQPET